MLMLIRSLLCAGAVAAAATPVPSFAQSFELDLDGGRPKLRLLEPEVERDYGDEREYRQPRRCSPERALAKAERMGLRRVRIESVDRNVIEVRGRRYGDRVIVAFERDRNCSIIDD